MNYIVSDDGHNFQGVNCSSFPELQAEITEASPLFLELVKQVHITGVPIHFSTVKLSAGEHLLSRGPGVMYRSDNPAEPGKQEG